MVRISVAVSLSVALALAACESVLAWNGSSTVDPLIAAGVAAAARLRLRLPPGRDGLRRPRWSPSR